MYLHFEKSEFPNLKYPKHEDGRFDYMDEHDLHQLPFHKGITFYEETKNLESGRTFVKVGCDYQHLYDEQSYGQDDCGEEILKTDGERVAESFKKLVGIE